jgi:hypothetical protein
MTKTSYAIGERLTGGQALDYLNEDWGERFVKSSGGGVYKFDRYHRTLSCWTNQGEWEDVNVSVSSWLPSPGSKGYEVCKDPSTFKQQESEYAQIEFAELVDEMVGGKYEPDADLSQSDLIRVLITYMDKHFQRIEK